MDSMSNVATTEVFQFKINHSKTKDMEVGNCFTSPKLRVRQYDWVVKYFPQGCNKEDNGKYVSVLLELQRESIYIDHVTAEFGFELLDKHGNVSPTTLKLILHTFTSKSLDCWGSSKFFERTKLEQTYIKDDCFVLRVSITVGNGKASNVTSSTGFPYERLQKFRKKNKHTDVTFNVDGKHFVAHRLIMAAHSPVFEAQLLGSMAESESDTECSIEIKEMMPSVFKAMIDFMYNGSLLIDDKFVDCQAVFLQHLLVAADRYAIEKLSVACVFKLVKSISFDTVLSTLELAEMHNSIVLKIACLRFIVENNDSVSLMSSEEYIKLMQNYPSLLAELKELAKEMRFSANFKKYQYLKNVIMKYYPQ
ncbi:BTB/POZ and MATH domain-containing protein 2-like [Carex rostrata]